MTWTYSGDPSDSDRDQVRFLIQDTQEKDQLFSDQEVAFLLVEEGNPLSAAIRATEILMAQFARKVDETAGRVSKSWNQRFKNYSDLHKKLKASKALRGIVPFAGGISQTQKDLLRDNTDRAEPFFTRRTHDFQRQNGEDEGRVVTNAIQEQEE